MADASSHRDSAAVATAASSWQANACLEKNTLEGGLDLLAAATGEDHVEECSSLI